MTHFDEAGHGIQVASVLPGGHGENKMLDEKLQMGLAIEEKPVRMA